MDLKELWDNQKGSILKRLASFLSSFLSSPDTVGVGLTIPLVSEPKPEPEVKAEPKTATPMKINDEGLALVKSFEGLYLKAYKCPADVWTIGYGHTGDVKEGEQITEQQAEELLRKDMNHFEAGVCSLVKVPVSSNEFSALVAFSFNVGLGALQKSTLLKKLNSGDKAGAADQFLVWDKVHGNVLEGLLRRRTAERALFIKKQ